MEEEISRSRGRRNRPPRTACCSGREAPAAGGSPAPSCETCPANPRPCAEPRRKRATNGRGCPRYTSPMRPAWQRRHRDRRHPCRADPHAEEVEPGNVMRCQLRLWSPREHDGTRPANPAGRSRYSSRRQPQRAPCHSRRRYCPWSPLPPPHELRDPIAVNVAIRRNSVNPLSRPRSAPATFPPRARGALAHFAQPLPSDRISGRFG